MSNRYDDVPRLDLEPKLRRPLSLLNPLDYLRLLFWVFCFPQALRWYLDIFGRESSPENEINWQKIFDWLKNNRIPRNLILQGLNLTVFISLVIEVILQMMGGKLQGSFLINFIFLRLITGLFLSLIAGLVSACSIGQEYGVSRGVAAGVASIIAFNLVLNIGVILLSSVAWNIAWSVASFFERQIASTVAHSVALGIILGVPWGIAWNVALSVGSGVAFRIMVGSLFGLILSILGGLFISFKSGWIYGIMSGLPFGIAFTVAASIVIPRLENWIFYLPIALLSVFNKSYKFPCVTFIPIPGLSSQLKICLRQDWEIGLQNANQLLAYSLQFIPVVQAVNQVISEFPSEQAIFRVAQLAESCVDYRLVRFASEKLSLWSGSDPEVVKLRLDTPTRAAAAGFWYLQVPVPVGWEGKILKNHYDTNLSKAIEAFTKVRFLPYGEEMLILTQFLAAFNDAFDLAAIALIQIPPFPKEKLLRPGTWQAIDGLCQVIKDAKLILHGVNNAAKFLALSRALLQLKNILQTNKLPRPENERILYIAHIWQQVLLDVANRLQTISIPNPVRNPYVIGNPVEGKLFVGRTDVLRQLEEFWILTQQLQSVVLYGHRRMGKSSILNNVDSHLGAGVKVAYVNLQRDIGQGVGEILIAISDAISDTLDIPPPADDELLKFPHRTFIRYLKKVEANLGEKALIIAIDEFEKLEEAIKSGTLEQDFIGFLRGLMQMSSRIAFAFAGLHTLEEMTEDYFQPFFASVIPIHVSFLKPKATHQLLTNPTEDFQLSYTPEALDQIYALTAGQPYLVQLIGFQLVRCFNDQVFEQEISRDPVFTIKDVETVINNPEFFKQGRYYFTGVWGQATQGATGQQVILKALAPYPKGLSIDAIAQATGLDDTTLQAALKTLQRHDVVEETDRHWHIVVELFRRWVLNL